MSEELELWSSRTCVAKGNLPFRTVVAWEDFRRVDVEKSIEGKRKVQ